MTIELLLQRYADNRESTLGLLLKQRPPMRPHLMAYTIEDEMRESKVSKETRIPPGRYAIVINRNLTPLTKKYQARFPAWFKFHLMLDKVPGFVGVYIHLGNDDDDTDGCILVGDSANNNSVALGEIRSSTVAFMRIYQELYDHLDQKGLAFLTIRDEKSLML